MQYYLVKLLSRIACLLPDSLLRSLGDFVGALLWPFVPRKRRAMAINNAMLVLGLDRQAATAVVRTSAVRFGRMFFEVLALPKLSKKNIDRHVIVEGRANIEEAYSHGRGVIIASAHSGNWELIGPTLALSGFPVVGVAQKQTNEAMDRLINELRTASGMKITYKDGVREMVSLLGQGMAIGLIMDQDAKEQGVFADFLGRQAATPAGPVSLARLKGAPIVPILITANVDGTHTLIIHPPVWLTRTADRDHDYFVTTQKLNAIIGDHIRAHPSEWFWLHNRWKTRPPHEKEAARQ
jgi:KDO2-lipid IV(A) lauroyltransferase